jgi:hypothetical protein
MLLALLFLAAGAVPAEDRILLQGLTDLEVWNTDAESEVFSRADGDTAPLGRLRLWSGVILSRRLDGFAMGTVEGGKAAEEGTTEVYLEQAYLRYTFEAPRRLLIQGGRLTIPFGNFSRRYFSSSNPLIGTPMNYPITYSYGIQLNGGAGRFDYMAAVLNGPVTRQEYLAQTSSAFRPALALGVTPVTGLRFGAYATRGSYLGDDVKPALPAGKSTGDYTELVTGFEAQFSRGHFEFNGEFTSSSLETPGTGTGRGHLSYLEPKYTWSPRWFTALRLEQGRTITVEPEIGVPWVQEKEKIRDLEVGAGFRTDPRFVVKASYRTEHLGGASATPDPEGRAFAVQFSYSFDVNSWLSRPR